ncbi:MAG: nickel pincer cofactor biosynthesis protein LarB [Spirochaetales bacterium]|nr:nickel pincer cofactor biosynthesis protein LarB [Spirochaetales bacterium]
MNPKTIEALFNQYKEGAIDIKDAMMKMKELPYKNLDYANLDNHRSLRTGFPEVVYAEGKSLEQLRGIISYQIKEGDTSILATRVTETQFEYLKDLSSELKYDPLSRTITLKRDDTEDIKNRYIAVVTGGTSDIPVAEEAAVTAEIFGSRVERIYDVGVAGIHRLFSKIDLIRRARVIVVVAGMEGALPSVVGGLVESPVIAVPTSIGYGASFNGLSALLTMLNSCAAGISVVNIDDGFGARYQACMINRIQ